MEEDANSSNDDETTSIRAELSQMSFEDLQRLKETLGAKVYDEAMFGRRKVGISHYKRTNKNRPREMSSKVAVPLVPKVSSRKQLVRDPRFDSLCGTFSEKAFRARYRFVGDIRQQEKQMLRDELKDETDPERKTKINYLITRIDNQEREEKLKKGKEERSLEERNKRISMLQRGQLPKFKSKVDTKIKNLVGNYETLKKSGKLKKHIEKQRKKNTQKDRKKLVQMTNE